MTIKKIAVFGTQGALSAKIAVSKILSEPQIKARTISENEQTKEFCPECGSSNKFDLDFKYECDDCGYVWAK